MVVCGARYGTTTPFQFPLRLYSRSHPHTKEHLFLRTHILECRSTTPFAPMCRPTPQQERRTGEKELCRSRRGAGDGVGRVLAPRDLIIALPTRRRERERGQTLGKVNTFGQDRTFEVPTFPPSLFQTVHFFFSISLLARRNSDCRQSFIQKLFAVRKRIMFCENNTFLIFHHSSQENVK